MGSPDLDDLPELFRFRFQRVVQFLQRRIETVLELFRRADVDRGWDHVVARLAHVDVIVRVDRILRTDRFAGELAAAVRDHLVRVRVRARAGTGLENIEREMLVEFAFHDFFRRLDDEGGAMRIEQAEIGVRLRGRPFEKAKRANEWPGKSLAADRKVQDGALSGGAVKCGVRNGHFAHRVFFHSSGPGLHAG